MVLIILDAGSRDELWWPVYLAETWGSCQFLEDCVIAIKLQPVATPQRWSWKRLVFQTNAQVVRSLELLALQ